MLKNISKLELTVGQKVFQFICDNDAPIADVKEAIFQMQKYVGMIEDKIKEQQETQKAEAPEVKTDLPLIEEVKPEV